MMVTAEELRGSPLIDLHKAVVEALRSLDMAGVSVVRVHRVAIDNAILVKYRHPSRPPLPKPRVGFSMIGGRTR